MNWAPANYSNYLSIVAAARHDEHGGNFMQRLQWFVTALGEQCRKHVLDAELVLVEWNPPADRADLAHALQWPTRTPLRCRIVRVPAEIHQRFEHAEALPLFQMIARNVGIRRAGGRFVLATHVDNLFNDALMAHLASHPLAPGEFYRIDRYDVPGDWPADLSVDQLLGQCPDRVLRVNRPPHSPPQPQGAMVQSLRDWLSDLGLCDPTMPRRLHTSACGDFLLMARRHWFELRGYPQWPMQPAHLDALLLHAAAFSGLRQRLFDDPMRIYHLEHAAAPPSSARRLSEQEFLDLAVAMRRGRQDVAVNDEDWGLAKEELVEVVLT